MSLRRRSLKLVSTRRGFTNATASASPGSLGHKKMLDPKKKSRPSSSSVESLTSDIDYVTSHMGGVQDQEINSAFF